MATTARGHMSLPAGATADSQKNYALQAQTNLDSNGVDADRERASFADNTVKYEATLRFINGAVRTTLDAMKSHNAEWATGDDHVDVPDLQCRRQRRRCAKPAAQCSGQQPGQMPTPWPGPTARLTKARRVVFQTICSATTRSRPVSGLAGHGDNTPGAA